MKRTLIAATFAMALLPLPPAITQQGPRFAAEPGAGSSTSSGGDYFVVASSPGGMVTQSLTLRNVGTERIEVNVGAVDARTSFLGGVHYNLVTDPRSQVGSWINLSETKVELSPGWSRDVSFTISVPAGAPPGNNIGGLALWLPQDEAPGPGQGQSGVGIVVKTRRIIAVQVDLPGGAGPHLTIASVSPAAKPDGLYMEIAITNDGTHFTKGRGFIELRTEKFRREFDIDTFVPRTSIKYPIKWTTENRSGPIRGRVEIRYGEQVAAWEDQFEVGADVKEELKDRFIEPDATKKSLGIQGLLESRGWVVPLGTGVGIGILISLFLMIWKRRRRKEEKRKEEERAAIVTIAAAEATKAAVEAAVAEVRKASRVKPKSRSTAAASSNNHNAKPSSKELKGRTPARAGKPKAATRKKPGSTASKGPPAEG